MATCPVGHDSSDEEYCDICGALMSGAPAPAGPVRAGAAPAVSAGQGGGEGAGGGCPDCGAPRTGRFCEDCGYDFVLGGGRPVAPPAAQPAPAAQPGASPPRSWQPAQPVRPGAPSQSWQPAQPVQPGRSGQGGQDGQAEQPGQGGEPARTGEPAASAQSPSSWQPVPVPPGQPAAGTGQAPPPGGWVAVIVADRAYYESMIGLGGPDAARVAFPPYCPERRTPLAGAEARIGRRSQSRSLVPEIDLSGPPEDPGVSHLHAVLLAQPDGTWQLVDPGSANGTLVNGETVEINVPVPLADGDRVHVGAWTLITVQRG